MTFKLSSHLYLHLNEFVFCGGKFLFFKCFEEGLEIKD